MLTVTHVLIQSSQVKANDAAGLVRITETSPCDVIFTLPESQAGMIARAMREREKDHFLPPLLAQAWDREQKELLGTGELVSIDNKIDSATGTVKLKARFPNNDDRLFPNQFVNVRLLAQTVNNAVTVPSSSVQLGAKGSYCYLVEKKDDSDNGTAIYRDVEPGITVENVTVINSGIEAGNLVVVDGIDRLRDNIEVHIAAEIETPRLLVNKPSSLPDSEKP